MAPTDTKAWNNLRRHAVNTGNLHLGELFGGEDKRFEAFSLRHSNLLLDYSKQRITRETTELLCNLARECDLSTWIDRLFSGDPINTSENRPALHTALRLPADNELRLNGNNIVHDIHETLLRMDEIVERIHAGQWRGYSGLPVDTIVNIGVGGSDLGPFMASKALSDWRLPAARKLQIIFVSTMDGSQLVDHLGSMNPATTLLSFPRSLLPRLTLFPMRTPRYSGCARPVAPMTRCYIAATLLVFPPMRIRWRIGASRPIAVSTFGTGSVVVIRCGRQSVYPSRLKSVW
jgi:hypothetical protein